MKYDLWWCSLADVKDEGWAVSRDGWVDDAAKQSPRLDYLQSYLEEKEGDKEPSYSLKDESICELR